MHLSQPVFVVTLGINPAWVGVLMTCCRIWDAFSDPTIAHINDNFRSRWGRRIPFLAVGGVLMGLLFATMYWFPRGWSPTAYFWYLAIISVCFYTAHSVAYVPHISLLPELSPDPKERTRLAGWRMAAMRMLGLGMVWFFPLTQLSVFSDTIEGLRVVATTAAAISIGLIFWTVFGVKERHLARVQHQRKVGFVEALRATMRLKPMYPLGLANIFTGLGGNLVNGLGFYLLVYYVEGGDLKTASIYNGYLGTAYLVTSLLLLGPAVSLATRIGRRRVFWLAVGMIVAGSLAKWFCYQPGGGYWVLLPYVLIGPGLTIAMTLIQAMIADLTDWDELHTGLRREAMISALQSWMEKTINSLTFAVVGFILLAVHFDVKLGPGQKPETFLWLRIIFTFLPIILITGSVIALHFFRIDEKTAREVRAELERRRGK